MTPSSESPTPVAAAPSPRRGIEWPTLGVAVTIYGSWLAVTYYSSAIAPPPLFLVGGWLTAWHSSLQHEVIHGHPTPSRRFNDLIAALPLSLWLPFDRYRRSHLQHHDAESITDPVQDPESRYLGRRTGPVARLEWALAAVQAPLLGRLLLGPPLVIVHAWTADAAAIVGRDGATARAWAWHLASMAPVLLWLQFVCHLSLITYATCFIYPGAALMLLRSFAEHRADPSPARRVAVVEGAGVLGLLFLNNNLHAVHHTWPAAPWYRLPELYRQHRSRLLSENGGLLYAGYGDVVGRFLLRSHDRLEHDEALLAAEVE
jgi:fatty acid desaturase